MVSRRFQKRSRKALEAFERRPLKDKDIIALVIDGKYLANHQMIICSGVDAEGHKIPLEFVETTTENAEAINGLLQDLIRQGLNFSEGLLCVVDGARGLHKALREVFGEYALVQRCQWHKRENVVGYLDESDKETYRRTLQRAYLLPGYEETKEALLEVHSELQCKKSQRGPLARGELRRDVGVAPVGAFLRSSAAPSRPPLRSRT